MSTLVTTTTYMTFREDPTTSSAISCNDLGCKNPGNDECRHPGCVAVNSLLYGNQGYSGLHGALGRRLIYATKKRLSFSLCFVSAFLTGTEYAIILPTVWKYLQQLGQTDERYIGYVTSAFSVGSILSHLVVGRIADQTRDSRHIILLVNLFQIVGQLIYAVGVGGITLIFARFLSGIGVGLNSALFADIVRGTGRRERPWYIVGSFMTRQLSIFLAPLYNTALRHLPVIQLPLRNGYTIKLDEGSYPGIVMAILWTCFELVVVLFFFNMTVERKAERYRRRQKRALFEIERTKAPLDLKPQEGKKDLRHQMSVKALTLGRSPSSVKLIPMNIQADSPPPMNKLEPSVSPSHVPGGYSDDERHPLLFDSGCHGSSDELMVRRGVSDASEGDDDDDEGTVDLGPVLPHRYHDEGSFWGNKARQPNSDSRLQELALVSVESMGQVTGSIYRQEFLSRHAIPLLFMQFTVLTCQTMVEAVIPPILECYFKYGPRENSYMFMAIGAEELIVLGILLMVSGVIKPSKRTPPRTMLLVSCVFMIIGLSGLMVTSRSIEDGFGGKSNNCPSVSENHPHFFRFAQCCALVFLGIPIAAVMSVSLLSQLLDYKVQGMGQGLGRFFCSLGMIVGPLWGGCLVYSPELLYGGAIAMVGVEIVLLIISFPALKLPD